MIEVKQKRVLDDEYSLFLFYEQSVQYFGAMKTTKQCSECGGTDIYTAETNAVAQGINLLPKFGTFWGIATIEIYICAKCGHHQMFVPEKYLAEVQEKYERYR
jgi:predicted nucleic-acid-binding Zn-ribbon protein